MKVVLNKNIGDVVWLMCDDHAVSGIIKNIFYRQFVSNLDYETIKTVEKYTVAIKDHRYVGSSKEVNCDKDELFPDKESLIKSL